MDDEEVIEMESQIEAIRLLEVSDINKWMEIFSEMPEDKEDNWVLEAIEKGTIYPYMGGTNSSVSLMVMTGFTMEIQTALAYAGDYLVRNEWGRLEVWDKEKHDWALDFYKQ